jgi:dTMP kinase
MLAESGLLRAHTRGLAHGTRYERFGTQFHEKLRRAFIEIAANEPERCVLLNGDRSQDEVARDVWQAVKDRLAP